MIFGAMTLGIPHVTELDLLSKGFFHDRMISPLSTLGLGPAVPDLVSMARNIMAEASANRYRTTGKLLPRSQCVQHSIPKRKHLRRILSIPNPLPQTILSCEVADHWPDLIALCQESDLSLSRPRLSKTRAIEFEHDRKKEFEERLKRSVGARFVLKTDIARFYPSVYTHSIGWAIHGKNASRADRNLHLYGNRLDLWLRETQDKQTGGIPIGPDTSFLIAEVIASRLDKAVSESLTLMGGTRYVDDYNLYFESLSEAEKALAVLHGIASEYELEINALKTEILETPEPFEPYWKTQLRAMELRENDHATSLKALFDRAFELTKEFPQDSVLTYVAKKVSSARVAAKDWEVCESLLLRSALAEPGVLPELPRIYKQHEATKSEALAKTIDSLCTYHGKFQHANEGAWSLWIARVFDISLSSQTAKAVTAVDDDVVALVGLDLIHKGLMADADTSLWASHMNADSLYSDHWLLAYEAWEQGWLKSGVPDYISVHCCPVKSRRESVG